MGGGSQGENKSKSDETQNGLNWHRNRIGSILRKLRVFEKQIKKNKKQSYFVSHYRVRSLRQTSRARRVIRDLVHVHIGNEDEQHTARNGAQKGQQWSWQN